MGFTFMTIKKKVICIQVSTLFEWRNFAWEAVKQKTTRDQT